MPQRKVAEGRVGFEDCDDAEQQQDGEEWIASVERADKGQL